MDIRSFINSFLVHLYFSKINNVYLDKLPDTKPILFVNLHRNGACDGWVYQNSFLRNRRFPALTFSSQLTRYIIGRMFFHGIEFIRKKDGVNREKNIQALQYCVDHLHKKKDLVIFPRGNLHEETQQQIATDVLRGIPGSPEIVEEQVFLL
ncbi:hypothetical protein [Candidatus Uabimicrobium sp. HlEnr_7]|uniref:hypothetical protein n=1 Tax=Candidatus Uabimicrobium helgolandensis TaxID=3095367 RepID=UPI003558397D